MGRVCQRGDLFGLRAQRLIQPQQQPRPKPPRQWRAGGIRKVSDPAQPHALQGHRRRLLDPQGRHRQGFERREHIPHRGRPLAIMRQGPGRAARIRQPDLHRQPAAHQPRPQIAKHRGLSAKQMRRTGDVHHQPIRPLKPHPRAIPRRPAPQEMQKPLILFGLGNTALQLGTKGAGIGKGHTLMQPLLRGLAVQAINAIGVLLFQGQRKRPFHRALTQNPVAGQPRKPQ